MAFGVELVSLAFLLCLVLGSVKSDDGELLAPFGFLENVK